MRCGLCCRLPNARRCAVPGRGGGVSSSLGGSSVAERNLDRITVGIGMVWFACVIGLGLLLKAGN